MSILDTRILLAKPGFSLELNCEIKDQITGIFGPSGAGKTSLLRLISGLETPDSGHIRIQDKEVFNDEKKINLPPEKRKIGYVFQEGRLFPHLNVLKNLKYGLRNKPNLQLFEEITEMLKITDLLTRRIPQISGGQAQRVAIGRALLSSPDLLIFDEPFSALDKKLRQQIISLMKPLINRLKIPILVVSHDLSDLLTLTDKLLIIQHGKCAGHGNYYDLINRKETVGEMSRSGLINSIEARPDYIDEKMGILVLSNGNQKIYAEARLDGQHFFDQTSIQIELRPEDITLATRKVEEISVQNQLKGKIEKLIVTDNKVLCIINHGFKLIAEVTLATKQKMKLAEGDVIWSLFKAAAVKINMHGIANSGEL